MDLTQPNFIVFNQSIQDIDQLYHYSLDTALKDRNLLLLAPNEVYNQSIILPIENITNIDFNLVDVNGLPLESDFDFGYELFDGYVFFSIQFNLEIPCLRIQLDINNLRYYSNKISVSEHHKERTTLVHYKHSNNIHLIPFESINEFDNNLWHKIRLPLYYLQSKTEQDSEEYEYYNNGKSLIQPSRIKRRFLEIWNVWGGDFVANRIAMISDYDCVYFDKLRRVCRPFEYSEIDLPDYMGESELEAQRMENDTIETDNNVLRLPHYDGRHYSELHYSIT